MTFNSINLSNAFKSSDKIYDDGSGNLFSGAEAYEDPEKMAIVQYEVLTNTATNLGISNNLEVSEALKLITTQNNTLINQAKTRSETKSREILTADINEHLLNAGMGGPEALVQAQLAWNNLKILKGDNALTHQAWRERIATGNYTQETINAMLKVDVFGDNRSYLDIYKTPLAPFLRQRDTEERKKFEAEKKQDRYEVELKYQNNEQAVGEFIDNKPWRAEKSIRKDFDGEIPPYLAEKLRVAQAGKKEELLYRIEQRANLGILSDSEINTYPSGDIREFALKQKKAQDMKVYGKFYKEIKEGFTSIAKEETGILDNAPGNYQTFLVEAELDRLYRAKVKSTDKEVPVDENQVILELKDLVLGGKKGEGVNVDNRFYRIKRNGKMFYPHLEDYDKDKAERRKEIMSEVEDKALGFFSKEYVMNTSKEMDEMFESSLSGPVEYTPIVYKIASILSKKTGKTVTPAKVFNYARKIDNEKTGLNKPYLQISANQERFEQEAADKELDKILSNPDSTAQQIRRVGASLNNNARNSIRLRGVQSTGMRGLADLVSSGEGSSTSMFPGENYPEMTNMTIKEVVEFQKEKLRDGRKSAAVGFAQFLFPENAAALAGLSLDEKFTLENQFKMFVGTILNKPDRKNLSAFVQGTSNDIELALDEFANEFSSIAGRDGQTAHKDGVNKASISRDQARAALISAREEFTTQ
jgi:hypothetical protein